MEIVFELFRLSNVFLTFAVIGIMAFFLVLGLVPETKGRSLENIEADMRQRAQVPVSSRP
jgi:hypothetical protein